MLTPAIPTAMRQAKLNLLYPIYCVAFFLLHISAHGLLNHLKTMLKRMSGVSNHSEGFLINFKVHSYIIYALTFCYILCTIESASFIALRRLEM
jgi:hypothetical protein